MPVVVNEAHPTPTAHIELLREELGPELGTERTVSAAGESSLVASLSWASIALVLVCAIVPLVWAIATRTYPQVKVLSILGGPTVG